MEIYLLRHGDAVDRITGDYARDEERPLTEKGQREARIAAESLQRLGVTIAQIFASPLVRATQTGDIAAETLRPERGLTRHDALAPGGNPEEVMAVLAGISPDDSVLLIGHMPDLGELAGWLVWGDPLVALPFRTGGLCRITAPTPPLPGQGNFRWFAPPKFLRKVG
ncbi:MAG TPA: phosphohistidine phosphatase SixA [Thermomicrobiales bacterium]|jgi:phosphohistidine phosphatase